MIMINSDVPKSGVNFTLFLNWNGLQSYYEIDKRKEIILIRNALWCLSGKWLFVRKYV